MSELQKVIIIAALVVLHAELQQAVRLAVNCCPMYAMSLCRGVREKDGVPQMTLIPNL